MTLWECPTCKGRVRGPQRPRKENLCRWCLPCSTTAGKLVARIAPTQEKQRAVASEKAKINAKLTRERVKEKTAAPYMVGAVNAYAEMRTLCKLRVFGGIKGTLYRTPPALTIHRSARGYRGKMGQAGGYEVALFTGPAWTREMVLAMLIHELVHVLLLRNGTYRTETSHGKTFKRTLRIAIRQMNRRLGTSIPDEYVKRQPSVIPGQHRPKEGPASERALPLVAS